MDFEAINPEQLEMPIGYAHGVLCPAGGRLLLLHSTRSDRRRLQRRGRHAQVASHHHVVPDRELTVQARHLAARGE